MDGNTNNILPVNAVTTKNIILKNPAGATFTKAATFETDGSDGVILYKCLPADLNQAGSWEIQVYLVWTPLDLYHGEVGSFQVFANLA